ncbi:Holliday junction branch migration protein RuvA [Clostridium aestuarii]|uniref:Holliday junction branch migration complex subunit RuvA n=1 Tax=Clostridium aestuarii TaxID=338193 RepID=A0ABT4CX86_9CLOT|nr:Holliday junction branch migration protein RuvA [Clostridium aestuarii]MCY6483613.1 Holliday junction branch migration protein RuvA [Clostridium aestuarii]
MYEYIKGIYIGINKDYIILENNDIGYKIYTSGSTMAKMPNINEVVKIYLQQIVREDFIGLYGFLTEEERDMFNLLLTINGVGSKATLSLLSISNINNLKYAILSSDYTTLTKAPGIGKKIAQRIILELKDKLGKLSEGDIQISEEISEKLQKTDRKHEEALLALISLGFSEKEGEKVLKTIDMNGNLEEIIKESLKHLMN